MPDPRHAGQPRATGRACDAFHAGLRLPAYPSMWSLDNVHGLAALNAELTNQAQMIAHLDDFKLLMWVTLAAAPLLLPLRRNAPQVPKEAMEAAVEQLRGFPLSP